MPKRTAFTIFAAIVLAGTCPAQSKDNDNQLALLYFSQGEYAKAAEIYRALFEQTHSQPHFDYLTACYKNLGDTPSAERITKEQIRRFPKSFYYPVKLATIYANSGRRNEANEVYSKTLKKLKDLDSYLLAGQACIDNKADSVARIVYEQGAAKYPGNAALTEHLGKMYLRTGETGRLADLYIALLNDNDDELQFIENQLQFSVYENSNPELKAALHAKLDDALAKGKKRIALSELKLWLATQDKDFASATDLAVKMDEDYDEDGDRVYDLGKIALSNADYTHATQCFAHVVQKGRMYALYDAALKQLLETSYKQLLSSNDQPDPAQLQNLEQEYQKALTEIGDSKIKAETIRNLAHLQAFFLSKGDDAISLLKDAAEQPNYRSAKHEIETELADIYLFTNDIWSANMLYASVALNYKNNDIGHEAQLQQARIAYYNGNFAYAHTLLDVLKGSTSKLIANDAFELSQLITDNTALDTSTAALALFAKADLCIFQRDYAQANAYFDSVAQQFPGHSLEDDILFRQASIAQTLHDTATFCQKLTCYCERFPYEIYAGNAHFMLARHYDESGETDKAKQHYKTLVTDYPDNYHSAFARKRYREL